MEICALASGSSGNCFYVGNDKAGILIDAGISAKQIVERMASLQLDPCKLQAIFITHEHSDHIRGSDVLARKLNLPVYATKATAQKGMLCRDAGLIRNIKRDSEIKIGRMKIQAFSKFHTAADPVSFSISESKKISIITDAGHACSNIQAHVASCDFLCIEANHDEAMLQAGPYPAFLKKWISSKEGHLSNREAALCILENASKNLNTIVLSHLSKTNNTPQHALKTFNEILLQRPGFSPKIEVSMRELPTQLYHI